MAIDLKDRPPPARPAARASRSHGGAFGVRCVAFDAAAGCQNASRARLRDSNDGSIVRCAGPANREAFRRGLTSKVSRDTMDDEDNGTEVPVRIPGFAEACRRGQGMPLP